ncbi:MAG: DUF4105 domain-containing protein [Taibaiella sp.]|nr:DUF4105 domain-containing protein [Taibaiella sp.]
MKRPLFLLYSFVLILALSLKATAGESHYRISILTGGPGEELWETFGHACIRVIDSNVSGPRHDLVYNYGFFDAANGSIGHQFVTGRVKVFLDTITFGELIVEYTDKRRALTEQELILSQSQKESIVSYLENNLRPQNRYYEYDAFFDNCTTRIRDMLYATLGKSLIMGTVSPGKKHATVRDVSIDPYCNAQHKPWFALALHLVYGSPIDRKMSNDDALFLPILLSQSLRGATIDGHPLAKDSLQLMQEKINWRSSSAPPVALFWLFPFLSAVGLVARRFSSFSRYFSLFVCTISGVIGCCLLYLWLIDAEPGWNNNLNILWAFPLNALVLLIPKRLFATYSCIALCALGLVFVVQLSGFQVFPLLSISPLLLSSVFLFAPNLRKS